MVAAISLTILQGLRGWGGQSSRTCVGFLCEVKRDGERCEAQASRVHKIGADADFCLTYVISKSCGIRLNSRKSQLYLLSWLGIELSWLG